MRVRTSGAVFTGLDPSSGVESVSFWDASGQQLKCAFELEFGSKFSFSFYFLN